MDKTLILNEIKKHYKFINDSAFAQFLGISPTRLSNWRTRNTLDYELISTICVDIDANWLLSGKGEMLKILDEQHQIIQEKKIDKEKYIELLEENRELRKEIDLLKKQKNSNASLHEMQMQEH